MRKPVVRVIGQSGNDLVPGWGDALTRITFTDAEGGDADEIEMEFSVAPPFPDPPAEGTQYRLLYGWDASALRDAGLFTFQSASINFDAESGWLMPIVARSADFVDADKSGDSEHFEETTAGEIFRKLAVGGGRPAIVHPSIADIEIPYRLRYMQSPIGFAQALADELGASLKLADGKWLVTAKNSGETASATTMPPIEIDIAAVVGVGINAEARSKFKDIEAGYFDPEKGIPLFETATGSGLAARAIVLHPAASIGEATIRSRAEATDLDRAEISGSLTVEGDPDAMAGAPVKLIGFGGWSGRDLTAPSIQHEFDFSESGGWLMTVETAARSKT